MCIAELCIRKKSLLWDKYLLETLQQCPIFLCTIIFLTHFFQQFNSFSIFWEKKRFFWKLLKIYSIIHFQFIIRKIFHRIFHTVEMLSDFSIFWMAMIVPLYKDPHVLNTPLRWRVRFFSLSTNLKLNIIGCFSTKKIFSFERWKCFRTVGKSVLKNMLWLWKTLWKRLKFFK